MFYVGKQKISPGFFSKGESSGDVITAKNRLGKNISAGDKVWINPYYYESGTDTYIDSGQYFKNNGYVSRDGNYFIKSQTYNDRLLNLESTDLGQVTTYSRVISSHNETPDGIWYAVNYNNDAFQRFDSGFGWIKSGYCPIRGTSEYITDGSTSDKIYKINPLNGEIIKTYSNENNKYYHGLNNNTYLGSNKMLLNISNIGRCLVELDDENNTWSITTYNVIIDYDSIIGVTSDFKYLLISENKIYDTTSWQNVYNTIEFPAKIYSERSYFDGKENIYQYHDGNLSDVSDSKNYKVVKYDTTTKTWNVISIDYETIMSGTNKQFIRACFNNGVITRAVYGDGDYGCHVVQITNDEGYNLIKYGIEVTSDTLTGVAKGAINTGNSGQVTTILP